MTLSLVNRGEEMYFIINGLIIGSTIEIRLLCSNVSCGIFVLVVCLFVYQFLCSLVV